MYFNDADYFLGNDLHCLKQTDLTVPPAMHFPVGNPVRWAGLAEKHGRRIFGPEDNAVDELGRKCHAADLMRIHGIAHEDIMLVKAVEEPWGIKGGNIRTAAYT